MDYSDHDLEAFLDCSGTPAPFLDRDYSSKLFQLILHEIRQHLGRGGEQIKAWVRAFLACVDIPSALTGLAQAKPILEYLLAKTFELSKQDVPEEAQAILTALFAVLNSPPLNQDQRYQQRPAQAQSQLFAFHLTAVNPFAPKKPPPDFTGELYRLWGFRIHRGLRGITGSPVLDDETKKAYATSARAFFTVVSEAPEVPAPSSRSEEDDLFQHHLDTFKARATAKKEELKWSPRTITIHCRRLEALYHGCPIDPHPHGRKGIEYLHEYLEGLDGEPCDSQAKDRAVGAAPTVHTMISTKADEALKEQYPDPNFHEVIQQTLSKGSTCPRLPHLSYKTMRRYILSNFGFWWDTTSLQRKDLSELYLIVEELNRASPGHVGLTLFLLLLLFTGRPLRQLLNLQIGRCGNLAQRTVNLDADRALFIDLHKACLFFQHRYRASFQAAPDQPWKPSLFWMSVPIPPPLRFLFRQYVKWLKGQGLQTAGAPFFHLAQGREAPTPLTLPIVRRVLERTGQRHGSTITAANLSQSFLPLFVHGFGLDEVSSRIISGRALGRAFAPVNYTRMPWQELHQRYARCCLALHCYASPETPSHGWWTATMESATDGSEAVEASGSPLVMTEERIQALAKILKTRIALTSRQPRPQHIEHHNAYVCYVYLLLLRLGLRPANRPGFQRKDFLDAVPFLPVSDKHSGHYYEERVIQLPPLVQDGLQQLASGEPRLRRYLLLYHGPAMAQSIPAELFFFLDPTGRPIAFKLALFDQYLTRLGGADFICVQRNVGRHSLRTSLWEQHLVDDVIGAWLGHLRGGRGPLELHASTILGAGLTLVSEHCERVLKAAGFERLPYVPF